MSDAATFGGPRWVGLFVRPVMFLILWALDRDPPDDGAAAKRFAPRPLAIRSTGDRKGPDRG
jgi:hypothetical protein